MGWLYPVDHHDVSRFLYLVRRFVCTPSKPARALTRERKHWDNNGCYFVVGVARRGWKGGGPSRGWARRESAAE
eukprot:2172425-Prymnesium_polylepis.1